MTDMNPKYGTTATCESCHRPIMWTGKYWEHLDTSPRHIAKPPTMIRQPLDLNLLDLLPPNCVTHFYPRAGFCNRLVDHINGRITIEVGAGQCKFAKMLASRGVKILAVEPRATNEVRKECMNFLLPRTAENVPLLKQSGLVVLVARPDHSGWLRDIFPLIHKESEFIYIGLEENLHLDIPRHVELECLCKGAGEDNESAWILKL
jgi:hypothetical protein